MLATANMVPDLREIPNTTNVIEDIGRQSLRVASLIHEYTKLSIAGYSLLCLPLNSSLTIVFFFFTERTVKIRIGELKSRIDTCRKDCASLKDKFFSRIHVDTNLQVKEIKVGVQQAGISLLVFCCLFSDLFAMA
jgi:hypothetical protein